MLGLFVHLQKILRKKFQKEILEDLFHRLNVFQIDIEPLNKRVQDIPLLIKYFSKKIADNYNLKKFNIDPDNHYLIDYLAGKC